MATDKNLQFDKYGVSVRIQRRKKLLHEYFATSQWGGAERAQKAAQQWRDDTLIKLRSQLNRHTKVRETRSIPGMNGVSCALHYDKRRDAKYLRYTAFWMDFNGERHNRTFQAGRWPGLTTFDHFKAYRAAVIFRKTYEWCLDNHVQFNPEKFRDWKFWL